MPLGSHLLCCFPRPPPGSSSPGLRAARGARPPAVTEGPPGGSSAPGLAVAGTRADVTLTVSRTSVFRFSLPPSTVSPASNFCAARGCHDVLFPSLLGPRAAVPAPRLCSRPAQPRADFLGPRVALPRPATCAL